LNDGHEITGVGRNPNPPNTIKHPSFHYLAADTTIPGSWQERVNENDIVINLAGKSIFTLWTKKVKQQIYNSRILTTRNLSSALVVTSKTLFISASAAGYYGDRADDILTEQEPGGNDFLAEVCQDWEEAALHAKADQTRVILTRFGIVMHREGGAMASMLPAFKFFLGGRLASGKQWFPWIHLDDLVAAKLNRPAMLPVPGFIIKTFLGEFGQALNCSQRTHPPETA